MAISTKSALRGEAQTIRNTIADRANTAVRVGDELISLIDSIPIYYVAVSDTYTGEQNTALIQSALDNARNGGIKRVCIPFVGTGRIKLTAPYRGTDGIYPGYVANDENRRANKALIIYDATDIELFAEPGVVLDRSADAVADTAYAPYAATVYISKSSNIYIHDLVCWGVQDDDELLNDVKNITSGASVDVNNGCDNIHLSNITTQDGSDGIRIGMGRTLAESFIDPAIPPCTNIFISNFENRNNEQGLLLMRVIGCEVNGFISRVWTREDATTGVTQRPLYLHSCEQVNITNMDLSGAFKTSVLVANYMPVMNVRISNFSIHDMMTWEEVFALKGSYPTLSYNGTGVSMQTDNCDGITFASGTIEGCATPVQYTGVGMKNVTFRDVDMYGVSSGFFANNTMWPSTTLDNPMENLTLDNVKIYVEQDLVNYSTLTPQMGLYLDSFAVDGAAAVINAKNTRLRDVYVFAQNRPGRVFNSDGSIKDCHFERQSGYGSARNFELNYSGNLIVEGVTCPVFSAPNRTQDVPTAALIRGRLTHFGDYAPDTVVSAPIGSVFYDQGGGAGVTMFVKESGAGTNTGWVAK
jgi:hypothetical protein